MGVEEWRGTGQLIHPMGTPGHQHKQWHLSLGRGQDVDPGGQRGVVWNIIWVLVQVQTKTGGWTAREWGLDYGTEGE